MISVDRSLRGFYRKYGIVMQRAHRAIAYARERSRNMNIALKILGQEQYITNIQGEPEFIVLPVEAYQQLIGFIEDYGLGVAMQEAEHDPRYNQEAALRFLEDEN
jgi:hypothetical protein